MIDRPFYRLSHIKIDVFKIIITQKYRLVKRKGVKKTEAGIFCPLRNASMLVIELFGGIFRLAGDVYSELFEYSVVGLRQNDRGMRLTAAQIGKMLESFG